MDQRVIRLNSERRARCIRGISMNCELIPRATAVGHSSGFCGFALAGYTTLSPDSALHTSRDEKQTLMKKGFFSPLVQLPNMKITSGGMIKPVWSVTTLVELDSPSHCRGPCEWRKNRRVILPGRSIDPNFGDSVDSPLRRTHGVRLI